MVSIAEVSDQPPLTQDFLEEEERGREQGMIDSQVLEGPTVTQGIGIRQEAFLTKSLEPIILDAPLQRVQREAQIEELLFLQKQDCGGNWSIDDPNKALIAIAEQLVDTDLPRAVDLVRQCSYAPWKTAGLLRLYTLSKEPFLLAEAKEIAQDVNQLTELYRFQMNNNCLEEGAKTYQLITDNLARHSSSTTHTLARLLHVRIPTFKSEREGEKEWMCETKKAILELANTYKPDGFECTISYALGHLLEFEEKNDYSEFEVLTTANTILKLDRESGDPKIYESHLPGALKALATFDFPAARDIFRQREWSSECFYRIESLFTLVHVGRLPRAQEEYDELIRLLPDPDYPLESLIQRFELEKHLNLEIAEETFNTAKNNVEKDSFTDLSKIFAVERTYSLPSMEETAKQLVDLIKQGNCTDICSAGLLALILFKIEKL